METSGSEQTNKSADDSKSGDGVTVKIPSKINKEQNINGSSSVGVSQDQGSVPSKDKISSERRISVSSNKLTLEGQYGTGKTVSNQNSAGKVDSESYSAGKSVRNSRKNTRKAKPSQNPGSQKHRESSPTPTEATPLLHGSDLENWAGFETGAPADSSDNVSGNIHNKRLWKIILFLVLLLSLMLIFLLLVDFQKLADEAFETDVQSISILGLHNRGVEFSVVGTVGTNYDNISNPILRHFVRAASLLVGGVVIAPRDKCSVYVSFDGIVGAHLLDIYPPEIPVDLIDHRISEIEFISDAVFASDKDVTQIIKSILNHGISEPLKLQVEVRLSPKISGKWFSFKLKTASIFQEISLPLNKYNSPLEISNLFVSDKNDRMEVNFSSSLPPIPAKFFIGEIEWDVAIPDCHTQPINIGEWETSSLIVDPHSSTNFQVHGNIEQLPSALITSCLNGFTPVNYFVRSFVNDKKSTAFISAKKSEINRRSLPEWLFNILTEVSVAVSIPVPHIGSSSGNLFDYDFAVDSCNVILETNEKGNLELKLDAKTYFELKSSSKVVDLNLAASKIKSTLVLSDSNRTLLEARLPGSSNVQLIPQSSKSDKVYFDLNNISASITEPRLAGQVLQSVLSGEKVSTPDWAIDLDEVYLKSSLELESILLKDLRFKKEPTVLNTIDTFQLMNSTFVNWILQNANISADKVFCVSSSPESVEFLVDFQVTNPLNASIEVVNDILFFDLRYNGSTVGKISLDKFKVPDTTERIMLTASLTLFYESAPQRILLEDLISHVISGSENTLVGVAGSKPESAKNDTGLSMLLQEIDIDGIVIPQLNFTHQEVSEWHPLVPKNFFRFKGKDLESQQSPILVDATFHLWSSEIELTVFNPIANVELKAKVLSCLASYKGESLAHIEESEILIIPPGVHSTPRIPIKISNGIGADILRKAINGDLAMDVVAELSVSVDQFPAELMYHGTGLTAKVKI